MTMTATKDQGILGKETHPGAPLVVDPGLKVLDFAKCLKCE